jgi:hypothetical protein
LYKDFEASKYQLVIDTCDEFITTYNGNDIIPKLELLKATALGRQQGYEVYKKALNFIALNYPNSDEGKQAQKIYSSVLSRIASKEFVDDESSLSFKLVYQYSITESELAYKMLEQLQKAIVFFKYDYNASVDYYSSETQLVVVHGLNSKLGTRGFGEILSEHKDYKIKKTFFEIAAENYKIIQIHKNLADYLNKEVIEPMESDTQK